MPGKRVCEICFTQATADREAENLRMVLLVKQAVQESLQASQPRTFLAGNYQSEGSVDLAQGASAQSVISENESGELDSDDKEPESFDFALVHPFVKSIRRTLQWEDPAQEPSSKRKFFKRPGKEVQNFPFIEEIQELFQEEWAKVEKKALPHNRFSKLYPFKTGVMKNFENAPAVDAALTRMARHVTLPLDDAVSFRDSLDRRADVDLRRVYLTAGCASKPAVALTSVSKALEKWAGTLEETAFRESARGEFSAALRDVKLTAAFLAEASIDLVRLLARTMLWATTARRALWLRPWLADPISKQSWCKIPFEGQSLFGDKLEAAIAKATGGKSGFLPQDRRLAKQQRFFPAGTTQGRLREARSYRPGRDQKRPWKNPRPSQAGAQKPPFFSRGGQKSF